MLDMIEVTKNTIESVGTDFPPETMDSQNELGEAITNLWAAHANAKIAARATNEELRTLRAKLGERLHELKQVLAQPGRGGQWSSFLRKRGIPRATADRLVAHYEQSINPDANRPSEATSEATEKEVETLFTAMWPKLRRTVRSRQSVLLFIDLLTSHYESSEIGDREIAVLAPPLPTICPVSSDGDFFIERELGAADVARADEQVS
jgi:hypothetical protein